MSLRLFFTLMLLPVVVVAAAPPIEFNGILVQGDKTSVSLVHPTPARPTAACAGKLAGRLGSALELEADVVGVDL